jgi:hypothetical protein
MVPPHPPPGRDKAWSRVIRVEKVTEVLQSGQNISGPSDLIRHVRNDKNLNTLHEAFDPISPTILVLL